MHIIKTLIIQKNIKKTIKIIHPEMHTDNILEVLQILGLFFL